jgi:DNA-binding PadR family transcriptional regulator
MQEVAERTNGQVRLWPAALYGLLRELEKSDLIVESDNRPAADQDDERRRYFALTPHGKRLLDAEVRRLEAIVSHARSSRALRKAARA